MSEGFSLSKIKNLTLNDGRSLEYYCSRPSGPAVIFHHGTANDLSTAQLLEPAIHKLGARVISYSRPGYAGSSPMKGRSVQSCVEDIRALLEALKLDSFVTAGWSAGGPHALALAAAFPDRCRGASVIGSVGMPDEHFRKGMSELTMMVLTLAELGEPELRQWIVENREMMLCDSSQALIASLDLLLADSDRDALNDGFAELLLGALHRAMETENGWVEDHLTLVKNWGFSPETIGCSVTVWCGDEDRVIPPSHSRGLAKVMKSAEVRMVKGEGHYSILWNNRSAIVCELINKF
ncbi:alpha/beta fold hydrolase [Endozoicomonas arenosclerae]|uniref:alpha/beta fold hydrolase n=1 Tax=Endozoicomonas arenosclerae TaxID=1633495 RepID=UPI000785F2A1|nr:alpha/beta hydrolase [Endozoicomonas arenosclerae]